MRRTQALWLIWVLFLLTGCALPARQVVLQPPARDVLSSEELPESLVHLSIYWNNHLIYLNGEPVEPDPIRQLLDEMRIVSPGSIPKFSHQRRYLVYAKVAATKILLWDLDTNTREWLVEAGRNLPPGVKISDYAFMPDDDKVIFAYGWEGRNPDWDLALVDIETGEVESLNIGGFISDFGQLNVSPDGKWAATDMVTLDSRVCLLVNLEMRRVECLNIEKGWYNDVKFLPDLEHIVYVHKREILSPNTVMLSRLDGTENRVLVSGFVHAAIFTVSSTRV